MKCSRAALFLLLFVLGVIVFALGPANGQERAVTNQTAQQPPYENMFCQYGRSQDVDGWRSYHAKDGPQLSTPQSELSKNASAAESEIENPPVQYAYGYKYTRSADGYYGIGSYGSSYREAAQNSEEDAEKSPENNDAERHDYVYDYHDYKARYGYHDEPAQSVEDQPIQPESSDAGESSHEKTEMAQSPQMESEDNGEAGYYYPYELTYDADGQDAPSSDTTDVSEEVESADTEQPGTEQPVAEQEDYSYEYESEYESYYKNGYQQGVGMDGDSEGTEDADESDPYAYDYSTYYEGEQASTDDETVTVEDLTPEAEVETSETTSAGNEYDYSEYYPHGYRGHYADQNWYGRFRQSSGVASSEEYRGYSEAYPVQEHAYVESQPAPSVPPEQTLPEAESAYQYNYTYEYTDPKQKYGNEEADTPEADDQSQSSTYYYEWDVAEETAPTIALSDWLPSQLLTDEDREVLRILKRFSEEPSGTRRATLSDHLENLGREAIEFATQFEDATGIDVLGLADDVPSAAAMIATFRLIERGEVETEQAVEVLREGLLQLDNQWLSELAELTSEPVDQVGQWQTVRKAVDCLACASVGHLSGITRLVWRNLQAIDWQAWAYKPSDEPEIGNLEAPWERY